MGPCGPLWAPVAAKSCPFKMMRSGKVHSAVQEDCHLQDGRLQGIAVMADWSLQDRKVLMDCRCNLHARALEEVGGYIYIYICIYIYIDIYIYILVLNKEK